MAGYIEYRYRYPIGHYRGKEEKCETILKEKSEKDGKLDKHGMCRIISNNITR